MPTLGLNYAPSLQFASDMLFVTGAAGAVYADLKMHRTVMRFQGTGPAFIDRRELYRLVVICLVFTLLIASAMLLPIIYGLNAPGGIREHFGPQAGEVLIAAWALNACACVWGVLRLTRGQYGDRTRYGAAAVIALTSVMAGVHNYFWMVKPSELPRVMDPKLAGGLLTLLGIICIIGVRRLAGDSSVGPLFEWQRLRVRAFGWVVIAANMFLMTVVNVLSFPITRSFLPLHLRMLWPMAVTGLLGWFYYLRRDSVEKSRKMTGKMLLLLAAEVAALWAILTYLPRH